MKRRNPEQQQSDAFIQHVRQFYPEIFKSLFHIPNESKTAYHADSGVKSGVPDFCYAVARGKSHALYIEMKAPGRRNHKNGGLSDDQVEVIGTLTSNSNHCSVCYTWQEALGVLMAYDAQGIVLDKDK